MRLPFTTNRKGATPVPVTIEKDDGPRLSIEEWRELAQGWPVQAKTPKAPPAAQASLSDGPEPQGVTQEGWRRVKVTLHADATPNTDRLDALCDVFPDVRKSLDDKKPLTDESASGFDMSLASYAAQGGWGNQEICDLLLYHRRRRGHDMQLTRLDYYQRTINTARAGQPITKEHVQTAPLSELAGLGILRILELLDDPNLAVSHRDQGPQS